MRRSLRKSIKVYLKEKIKRQAMPMASNAAATATTTISAATSCLISTCRHPRTPSISLNINGRPPTSFKASTKHGEALASLETSADHAATLSDIERFLFENFNSLFLQEDDSQANPTDHQRYVEPPFDDAPPSKHYFIFSDARGNFNPKIASQESKLATEESSSEHVQATISDGSLVAVRTLSNDPYSDFRWSMEEVMAARGGGCASVDWDFMEELLLCYLDMNDQSVHKYVLEAFSDLAVCARRRRRRPAAAGGGRRRKVREVVVDV